MQTEDKEFRVLEMVLELNLKRLGKITLILIQLTPNVREPCIVLLMTFRKAFKYLSATITSAVE